MDLYSVPQNALLCKTALDFFFEMNDLFLARTIAYYPT